MEKQKNTKSTTKCGRYEIRNTVGKKTLYVYHSKWYTDVRTGNKVQDILTVFSDFTEETGRKALIKNLKIK